MNDSNSAASPPGPSTALTNTSMTWSGVLALSSLASQTPSAPTPADVVSSRPTAIATAVFPIPPAPTISTNRSEARRSDDGGNLGLAADQLCHQRGQVPGPPWRAGPGCGACRELERSILEQDSSLEFLKLRSRVKTQLARPAESGPRGRRPTHLPAVRLGTGR